MKSMLRGYIGALCALAVLTGCVIDSVVQEQESEMQAAQREIKLLEAKLQALRAETRKLEVKAGPEAVAKRKAELEAELGKFGLRVTSRGPELVVTLAGTVVFDPGTAHVCETAEPTLRAVAKALKEKFPDRAVRIEGHTDSNPPKRVAERFPTNWELSAARSLAVLHFLVKEGGVPRDRIFAAAYGQHRPVKDNASPEGREENRRVDIVIVPPVGMQRVETAEFTP
jgi:chemotaxis protein MotB